MSKIIFIFWIFFSLPLYIYSQGWFSQNSGVTYRLNGCSFVNGNVGYAAGDSATWHGRIIKTINGGANWTVLTGLSSSSISFTSVFFIDEFTGYVGGSDFNGTFGAIYKTTNGGVSWIQQLVNPFYGVYSINFVNEQTGFGVGSYKSGGSPFLKTTNGGQSWSHTSFFTNFRQYGLHFINASTGWSVGVMGSILKTTNGGVSWFQQTSNTSAILRSVQFINASTGYAAGFDSKVYKTTNGGTNWALFYNQSLCGLYSVYFANEQTGWVCGCEAAINGTTNNGTNWVLQSFASTTYLYSLSFVSASTGWAVGFGGKILKTTTGGITAIQPVSNEIPEKFSLLQNYPNPFNPTTKIRFDIPPPAKAGQVMEGDRGRMVKITIYDILGREITTLVNEHLSAGTYEVEWDASNYPSGVYYYKFINSEFQQTKKMILIK